MSDVPLDPILLTHPFFSGLDTAQRARIAPCATPTVFVTGQTVFHEGGDANAFHIIRVGTVVLEVMIPGRGMISLQSLHDGDVLGWSWITPPHRWTFSARALSPVQTLAISAPGLRALMDADHELAYHLLKHITATMADRLHAARLQMLDLYAPTRS